MKLLSRPPTTADVAAFIAAAIVVAYANSMSIGFYFDDAYGIAANPAIRSLSNIPRFFADPFTLTALRDNVDVRPLLVTTFAINHAISGLAPWSYHAFNLALHAVACLLTFVIVRDHCWWPADQRGPQGGATLPAAATALFFALAPINTQALDYAWARSTLLCTTLYLGAFLAHLRGRTAVMGALHALALLTKAVALTLPVAVLAHDAIYRDRARHPTLRAWARDWRRLLVPVGTLAALNVAYLVMRKAMLPSWVQSANQEAWVTPWIWFMSQWSGQLEYVRLFIWPRGLSVDHDFPYTTSILQPRAWLALGVIVAWLVVAFRGAARRPVPAFATAWFFITLFTESSFTPLAEVINDHRPYIATSLGLSLLLAWALHSASSLAGRRAPAALVGVTVLLCAAAIPVIWHRNWEWRDGTRLWVATAETSPLNGRAVMNAGRALMSRGDLAGARRYLERARELSPEYAHVYMNLSALEAAEGHLDEALRLADEAVRFRPAEPRCHLYRGEALRKLGRLDDAAAAYQRALSLDPGLTDALDALSSVGAEAKMRAGLDALYQLDDPGQAVARFREVLAINPNHYGATYQLAKALDVAGRSAEATPVWRKMLDLAEESRDEPTLATVRARLGEDAGGSPGASAPR